MPDDTQIDFTHYSNEQLETSLLSIDKGRFVENYQACQAEIEKRKADGRWDLFKQKKKREYFKHANKWARAMAIVQVFGAGLGVFLFVKNYGEAVLRGQLSFGNYILMGIILLLFSGTGWAAWRYFRSGEDKNGVWSTLLCFQIPIFLIGNVGYEFYSGIAIPLGIAGTRLSITAKLDTACTILFNAQNSNLVLQINLAAIFILAMIRKAEKNRAAAQPSS